MPGRPIIIAGALSFIYTASFATTPQTVPAPNQSVTIEERPVAVANGVQKDRTQAATEPGGPETVEEARDVALGTAPVRPPTFLARRKSIGDMEQTAGTSTPWYRSTFSALAIVLGLIGILYLGLRRWAPSAKSPETGMVLVLSRTVLGPRQSAVLLRVGDRIVMVGVSPDRIDPLCEIHGADEVAALTAQVGLKNSTGQFASWLDREAAQFAAAPELGKQQDRKKGVRPLADLLEKLRTTKV